MAQKNDRGVDNNQPSLLERVLNEASPRRSAVRSLRCSPVPDLLVLFLPARSLCHLAEMKRVASTIQSSCVMQRIVSREIVQHARLILRWAEGKCVDILCKQ
jgi:hypothetical protein